MKSKITTGVGFVLLLAAILLITIVPGLNDSLTDLGSITMVLSMMMSLPLIVIGGIEQHPSTKGGML